MEVYNSLAIDTILNTNSSPYSTNAQSPEHIDGSVQTAYDVFKIFFENINHPMFIIDMCHNPTKAKDNLLNPGAYSLVKSCNKDFYEGSYLEKFDGSLSDFISSMLSKMAQKIFYSDMIRIPSVPGTKAVFSFSASLFDVDSESRALGIVLTELSKNVEEELTAVDTFKTSLISALSHELNNPMNSLIPIVEMMPCGCIHQTDNELKEMALSNIYILQHKIKDLLDYATMEISEIKLDLTEFSLNDLFSELQKLFRLEVEHKFNVLIPTMQTHTSKKLKLYADRDRLKQILIKLISNANKFTYKGIISLTAEEIKGNFNIRFTVKDTGIGIAKEKVDVLFASLSQKNKTYSESAKLPGLGLEIAKGLCKCMSSKLKVISEEGKGTEFTFEIPMCRVVNFEHLASLTQREEQKVNRASFASNMNVLNLSRNHFVLHFLVESKVGRSQFWGIFNNIKTGRDDVIKPRKTRSDLQRLLSDFFFPEFPWDTDNLYFEEHSDVTKKLIPYSSVGPRDKRNVQSSGSSTAEAIGSKVKKKIVLITDDSYYNRKAVGEMINRRRILTMEAINGEDAVTKIKDSFDKDSDLDIRLILMDLEMPILGGIDATVEIRRLEKVYNKERRIPIVAVTAHNSGNHRNECFKAGMQEHIVKPITGEILKGILERYAADLVREVAAMGKTLIAN